MSRPNDDADDVVVNRVIAGRYRVDSQIAKGGMAVVYKATDQTLNRVVALKILKPVAAADDPGKLTARFKLEAQSLAKLNHRNIVSIFDYGETEEGGYYLAMEYVDGPSLSNLIRSERLSLERAMKIVLNVCRALRYAHKAGIIHRDLKPGNILITKEEDEETAKLVDFGLAKLSEDQAFTQHGIILGTVNCMAPEQIRGGKIDPRTDIYAMGVVLFRLITGQYPFQAKQPPEVLAAHLHSPVPSFSSIDSELLVPPGLEDVVRKCLQKDPANRFQDAGQLINDLAKCLEVPPEQFVSVSLVITDLPPLDPPQSTNGLLVGGLLLGSGALLLVAGAIALAVALALVDNNPTGAAGGQAPLPVDAVAAPIQPPVPAVAAPEVPVAPAPAAPQAAPAPAPAAAGPKPAQSAAAAPAPEPVRATEATVAAPRPAPQPAPASNAPVTLQNVAVATETDKVVVTLRMSNANVRPLAFASEGNSGSFKKQYRINFKGGANASGSSSVPVGHALVESVELAVQNGVLVVVVNSKSTPAMKLEGSGPEYRVVIQQ